MASAVHRHQHQIKAPNPAGWLLKATPPSRDAARKLPDAATAAVVAYSPLLLSPAVWSKAQANKKCKTGKSDDPSSPKISCMGTVKGGGSSARGGPASRSSAGFSLAKLALGLFGRGRARSKASSKVRDVPRAARVGAAAPFVIDPPLPVMRRPARDENAVSLWERRNGGARALEGLRLR